jgi:hypothetical protein
MSEGRFSGRARRRRADVTGDRRWGTGAEGRAHQIHPFVTFLRWSTVIFAVASVVAAIVLAVRAPDCIAIGVSVLRAEDCTNRDTYYLLLAASVAASMCFSLLLFASAYALELLCILAFGRRDGAAEDDASSR